jgi:hypothetical protein
MRLDLNPDDMVYATRADEQDEFIWGVPDKFVAHQVADCLAGVPATYLAIAGINFSVDAADTCFDAAYSFIRSFHDDAVPWLDKPRDDQPWRRNVKVSDRDEHMPAETLFNWVSVRITKGQQDNWIPGNVAVICGLVMANPTSGARG